MLALMTGEAPTDKYAVEVLTHAGIPFQIATPKNLHPDRTQLCLLAGRRTLTVEEREKLRWFIQQGCHLIVVGNTSGLDDLLGVSLAGDLTEGWLQFKTPHPIGKDLQSSLHVFGGALVRAGSETQVLAQVVDRKGEVLGDAVTVRQIGQGLVIFIAPDLMRSITHIQQGIAVVKDGVPAPDGSAPIDDGILKAEDGHVLDWERDRTEIVQAGRNGSERKWIFFGFPVADELRALLLQAIFFAAEQKALPLPMLWYWRDNIPAVGLISHDTDGNEPELGWELLGLIGSLGIATTWCVIYPGGYPQSLYRAILDTGCEIALHFDAFTGTPLTTWSKRNFGVQWQWLKDTTGVSAFSNKNHYTRWEGRLEFFRWCEEFGVQAEQSKGPSKQGAIGFLFGGSHPWRPLDDERERARFLSVTEINLFSQDMVSDDTPIDIYFHPGIVPASVGEWLLRQTVRMGGVAHFLFHPAHIRRQGTKAALKRLVTYGQELGIRWWTSEQIVDWLNRRRGVRHVVKFVKGRWVWELKPEKPLTNATLMKLLPQNEGHFAARFVHGFPFSAQTIPLTSELHLTL
ncbi:MAG: hypothetical protein ACUVRR_09740 [Candidatus Fervidibacter sp.]|uniref:hypothetical protein n=1 Tax=Candidatus Fervidibacter sp. TaxID=3100871 RepID=UPI004049913A